MTELRLKESLWDSPDNAKLIDINKFNPDGTAEMKERQVLMCKLCPDGLQHI